MLELLRNHPIGFGELRVAAVFFIACCVGLLLPKGWFSLISWRLSGVYRVLTYSFIHGNLAHFIGNLSILGIITVVYAAVEFPPLGATPTLAVALMGGALGGGLTSFFVNIPGTQTVGASAALHGATAFFIVRALTSGKLTIISTVLLLVVFGLVSIVDFLPHRTEDGSKVSWQAHLGGALGGGLVAFV